MAKLNHRTWIVACLLTATAGCHSHPSKDIPALWGDPTAFMDPLVVIVGATGAETRDSIRHLLEENDLEIRWSNTTALDGEYIFQSARELKMKITYQSVSTDVTRIQIYRTTTDQTLQMLLRDALAQRLSATRNPAHTNAVNTPTTPVGSPEK